MMKNMRFAANLGLLGLSVAGLMATSSANAQTFLVGAYLFGANGSGATTAPGYQYDTNTSNVASFGLNVTPPNVSKGLSDALSTGANTFTFSFTNTPSSPGADADLGLFFGPTGTSYNPATDSRTPDLLVSRDTTGALAFFVPASSTVINDYHYNGTLLTANGLTGIVVGGNTVSVSAYSVNTTPTGTFTLTVTPFVAATPEPGVVGLLAGISVSGGVFALRRRRRNVKK
jgi:hypothetical protein